MLYGKEHVDRYVATNGEEGYTWRNGAEILILTTRGRKSGELRSNALIFGDNPRNYAPGFARTGEGFPELNPERFVIKAVQELSAMA